MFGFQRLDYNLLSAMKVLAPPHRSKMRGPSGYASPCSTSRLAWCRTLAGLSSNAPIC